MGKIAKWVKEVAQEAAGTHLDTCPGRTDLGVACKKKKRPGYPGCGRPECSSSHGF